MEKVIYFDMDGTLANFYGVENWLPRIRRYDATPYTEAKPLFNFSRFARVLHKMQRNGYKIGIVSWLSKDGSNATFNENITNAKMAWLKKHLPSVEWDEIIVTLHGTPKSEVVTFKGGVLFDDELNNRIEWGEGAFDVDNIIDTMLSLLD